MHWTAARKDFKVLALPTQQNQGSSIARTHHRFTRASRRLQYIVHGKIQRKIQKRQPIWDFSHGTADEHLERNLAEGRLPLLKSPLTLLWLLVLALGVVQSAPLPARLARSVRTRL